MDRTIGISARIRHPDSPAGGGESAGAFRILNPGRNCSGTPLARRAAILIEGATYFRHLEHALRLAERTIFIVGWDFDAAIKLRAEGDETAPRIGDLLRTLVEERPALEVRILVWSLSTIYAPGALLPLLRDTPWEMHPRIQFRLDTRHPPYAAHHQKIVAIDDALAFAGGIDLTVHRWDTSRHAADDPARVSVYGKPYGGVHDIQMAVEGPAARAIGAIARERWVNATGETPALPQSEPRTLWPDSLVPDFRDIPVAIARTAPAWDGLPQRREGASLTIDAIRAARRTLYIETQYLSARRVRDALAALLGRADGPEIVILATLASRGMTERFVMGGNRDRLIRRLRRLDRHDRLRVYYPVVPAPDGPREVKVHSKLIIVDDDFIRVGSSNLNNRSVGLDTECDLAVEALTGTDRRAVAGLRARLLAEHLDATAEAFEAALAETGSLIKAIERLNTSPRCLHPFRVRRIGPTASMPGTRFLDPEKPFGPVTYAGRWLRRCGRLFRAAASLNPNSANPRSSGTRK